MRWAAVGLAVFGLLAVTLPWWLGGLFALVSPWQGFAVQRYERIGYARFVLHGVTLDRPGVSVRLERFEADTPLLWGWRTLRRGAPRVSGGTWEVLIAGTETGNNANPAPSGWLPLRSQLVRIAGQLDRWLPDTVLGEGRVRWVGGGMEFGAATWRERTLVVERVSGAGWSGGASVAVPATGDVLILEARSPEKSLSARLESRGAAVTGAIRWHEQPLQLDAGYADRGWLPARAAVIAETWRLPGAAVGTGELYATVQGGGRIEWEGGQFRADLAATGVPLAERAVPPLDLRLRGSGGLEAFRIEALDFLMPGVEARLSAPVVLGRNGRISGEDARFTFAADLARLPWGGTSGRLNGRLQVVTPGGGSPVVDFEGEAQDLVSGEWRVARAELGGRLDWPRLRLDRATLVPAEGGRIEVTGGWDFSAQEITGATVAGEMPRASVARWLPAALDFGRATFTAQLAGPLPALRHAGTVTGEAVTWEQTKPLAVSLDWAGTGAAVDAFAVTGAAGNTALRAGGAVDPDRMRLDRLELVQAGTTRLALSAPAVVRWAPTLAVEELRLGSDTGSGLSLQLVAGPSGRIALQAHRIASEWWHDLWVVPGPAWEISELALAAQWDRGPVEGTVQLQGRVDFGGPQGAVVAASVRSEAGGWNIDQLAVSENGTAVVNASGRLGLALHLDEAPLVRIDTGAPLAFALAAAPNAGFWKQFRELSGLDLEAPEASARLTGTWDRPEGELRVRAARVAWHGAAPASPLPVVEDLDLLAAGDAGGITLRQLSLRLEGQPASATGRLVVPAAGWSEVWRDPLAAVRRGGEGEVNLPDADLAALARLAPEYLAPQGRLAARVRVLPGGEWDGWLELTDAASRPLGPLAALREVNLRLRFEVDTLVVERSRAQLGGQPVTLLGSMGLAAGGLGRTDLSLRADNVPLARQPGLLVRADLDLRLVATEGTAPQLSGTVTLRDSLLLSDLQSLLSRGPRGSSRPPPYFAVETPGLRDWRLAVAIRGERFLRLRTALFVGVASARFEVGGTLGVPWAIGEATVEEGRLMLPFSNFAVSRGRVTLGAANPHEPQLAITGTGRSHGYDLGLEVSGPASDPVMQFTSSPPLSSEQVLLLVMAGEFPNEETTAAGRSRFASLGTFLGRSLLRNVTGGQVDSDRLTLMAGDDVSRLGRETYGVEYEVNRKLSLLGEYDEYDQFNAGVRWRLFSKGGGETDDTR